ncbi:hypothetical protein KIW84_014117 [Lathyrus oleraceus]|uniref:Uncharacterized protein n=1 Tax=Pisum sativum TaxID=3888 RepID=A0A9D5BLZ3_PEA|nr:hypothetical protein KIW84_014117 [Pisum sativum]
MNQVIDIDNSLNMSTHPTQLLNVDIDTVTCDRIDVPEVIQSYSIVSPICGESTTSEFSEWPLPYMADIVARLKSPEDAAASFITFLRNVGAVQELKDDKHYNLQRLNDKY